MKIEFKKIPFKEVEIETEFEGLKLKGVLIKETPNLAKLNSHLNGNVTVPCIKCLNDFEKVINEELKLIITDRVFNGFDNEYDVIEIDKSFVDFDIILTSELESIKSDYNVCPNCVSEETDFIFE